MKGLCREKDPEVFFHPEGEKGRARRKRDELAKDICRACDVLVQCRSYALKVNEPYGIWGGMTERERDAKRNEMTRTRRRTDT